MFPEARAVERGARVMWTRRGASRASGRRSAGWRPADEEEGFGRALALEVDLASGLDHETDQDSRSSCSPCGGVRRCAIAAASCRCGTFSLRRMCETCTLAVFVLITSAAAISRLV